MCGVPLPPGLRRVRPAARADLHADHEGRRRARPAAHARRGARPGRRRARRAAEGADARDLRAGRGDRRSSAGSSSRTRSSSSGSAGGELILIDEVGTPDSSRFWPADGYAPGGPQPSFDKQYVRDWLDASGWDHEPPPPGAAAPRSSSDGRPYREAYERMTGEPFERTASGWACHPAPIDGSRVTFVVRGAGDVEAGAGRSAGQGRRGRAAGARVDERAATSTSASTSSSTSRPRTRRRRARRWRRWRPACCRTP